MAVTRRKHSAPPAPVSDYLSLFRISGSDRSLVRDLTKGEASPRHTGGKLGKVGAPRATRKAAKK